MELMLSVALENYTKLRLLPYNVKLRTSENGAIEYDDRWFLSSRRFITQNSRRDIIEPIKQTFILISREQMPDFSQVYDHTRKCLNALYPDDIQITKMFADIDLELINEKNVNIKEPEPIREQPPLIDPLVQLSEIAIVLPRKESSLIRRRSTVRQENPDEIIIDFSGDENELNESPQTCALIREVIQWFRERGSCIRL
jgi:hypothetical protein